MHVHFGSGPVHFHVVALVENPGDRPDPAGMASAAPVSQWTSWPGHRLGNHVAGVRGHVQPALSLGGVTTTTRRYLLADTWSARQTSLGHPGYLPGLYSRRQIGAASPRARPLEL